jgi:hypothetical protein
LPLLPLESPIIIEFIVVFTTVSIKVLIIGIKLITIVPSRLLFLGIPIFGEDGHIRIFLERISVWKSIEL